MPEHKALFLAASIAMVSLSLWSAVRERRRTGRSRGIALVVAALVATAVLLLWNLARYGSFM